MSASKKDQLLQNLTRRDGQKPPMEVTYENKGLIIDQITDRHSGETTGQMYRPNVSDESVKQKSTTQESDTSTGQMSEIKVHDTSTQQIGTTYVSDTSTEQMSSTHVYDTKYVHINSTHKVMAGVETDTVALLEEFKASVKSRQTVEDTHTRKTFIVRNDLLRELDKLSKRQPRGFQMWFVNTAFERLIEELKSPPNKDERQN